MFKNKLFALFFMVYLLYEPLMYSVMELTGQVSESGQMRWFVFVLTILAWLFYIPTFKVKDLLLWTCIFLFGALFYGTSLFQLSSNRLYMSHFMRWASTCVSFVALGLTLKRKPTESLNNIVLLIPFFTGALTLFIASLSISGISYYSYYSTESGFTYQSISYYMALFFGLNSFYLLSTWKGANKRRVIDFIAITTMLFNALISMMSGGRGGAILLLLYFILFVWELSFGRKVNRVIVFAGLIIVSGLFMLLSNRFSLTSAVGFSRTFSYLETDNRTELWRGCISRIPESPVIGHGLGSDFFLFGYYSHNILLDFLIETGIIGTFILLYVFTVVIINLYKNYRINYYYLLPLVLSIYALVFNSVSGYWISTQYHWLALGFASTEFFTFKRIKSNR